MPADGAAADTDDSDALSRRRFGGASTSMSSNADNGGGVRRNEGGGGSGGGEPRRKSSGGTELIWPGLTENESRNELKSSLSWAPRMGGAGTRDDAPSAKRPASGGSLLRLLASSCQSWLDMGEGGRQTKSASASAPEGRRAWAHSRNSAEAT